MHQRPHPDSSPFAPLPGTSPPRRALFVDRWGTLLEGPPADPSRTYDEILFQDGAVDALFRAVQAGWTIYLLGNEEAVARGHAPETAWKDFESRMLLALGAAGVVVERNYACLVDPEHGRGKQRADSVFLLPNTGAMYHARQHDGVHLGESWVIGDSSLELAAGWRAGCRTAGVRTGQGLGDGALEVDLDLEATDLASVLDHLASRLRAA